ncbi:unnamed protein product [Caretta caretta]
MWLLITVLSSLVLCLALEKIALEEGIPCSKYQVAFNLSCYEFVRLQRTFTSAQSWCERGGGHLIFIENEETQQFLQKHLSEDREWWIGLTSSSLQNETTEGSLIWLDTSNISYSNWHEDQPSLLANCGYILKNAGYEWGMTENCSQEFDFICEFESGHSIACDNFNATMQCGSGEVIQIADSFYGRKTPHYCILETPLQFDMEEDCSWTSVKDEVAGLQLAVTDTCFIFENITVSLKWLLSPYSGNLSCIISTGDGHTIDPYYPLTLSSNVTHQYTSPGEFTVFVECTTSEWHVTAQKLVTVQDKMDQLSITGCYSKYESGNSSHCRTLYGEMLWIQVELNGGTGVTYTVTADNTTLIDSSAKEGIVPHNLTLDGTSQQLIGPGVHQLEILATSNTTTSEISESIVVHLVEPISSLQAALASHTLEMGKDLEINVSVAHGAPDKLKFEVVGSNETYSHQKDSPKGEPRIYSIPVHSEGTFVVKVLALNAFSNMSLEIGSITVLANNSLKEDLSQNKGKSKANSRKTNVSIVQKDDKRKNKIYIKPSRHVDPFTTVTLDWPDDNDNSTFTWACGACWPGWQECVQQQVIPTDQSMAQIPPSCLPPPNSAVTLQVIVRNHGKEEKQDEQCLYVTARQELHPEIRCETNCKLVNVTTEVALRATVQEGSQAVQYNWYLDNTFQSKPPSLPSVCNLKGFRQSSLTLLQSNRSTLVLNSSFLQTHGEAFRIKVTAMTQHEYGDETYVVSMMPSPVVPVCAISPEEGSVCTSFTISCSTACSEDSCPPAHSSLLTYCFYLKSGSLLNCGPHPELLSVYLPLGEEENNFVLHITITVSNKFGDTVQTDATVKVRREDMNTGNQTLQATLAEKANAILKEGNNSMSLFQLYKSVSSVLNQESQGDTFNTSLQTDTRREVEASNSLKDVSEFLLTVSTEDSEDYQKRKDAAGYLFNASLVSHQLLDTVENLQSTLLIGKLPDDEPMVLIAPSVAMYINRLQTDSMDSTSINISNSSSASFTLPSASSLSVSGDSDETVDIRMVSFSVNPFSLSDTSFEISGTVGGLSLTSVDGLVIPVNDLTENIEIMLPRLSAPQEDRSLLNLGNFSALQVNVTSENTSLVIHLETEQDIPLILYLGYGYHPNETNYDMKAHLPLKKNTGDKSNTWVLSPEELIFGEGTYYLMMEQDMEMDSTTNRDLTIAVTSFVSQCVFWDELRGNWNSYGCHVGPKTTPSSTQCLCNHLTFFGSTFFVTPNTIDVSKTAELFGTFVDNPVVVTTVGCIFLVYVLVAIWARRKDIQDDAKVKITVLEDNDPFAQYRYLVTVFTGHRRGAATTSKVTLTLYGLEGESEPHHLTDPDTLVFERGGVDVFLLCTLFPLGELQHIRLWHDNSGDSPSWYVNRVLVHDLAQDQKWYFLCNSWLAIDVGECVLDKVFPVATEQDMKQFSNLFFMKTSKGFQDGHIWYSIFNRSPRSTFTRAQRVSCCFSLLLCTMLTSIMFWGVPKDPAEQKMDLGKIEFTWQEVMIGFESSLLMFPINLLIVQIFRNTHSRDIRRIANSLFKTLKTPLPSSETDPGKSTDINTLLALVEDIICQQNRAGQEFYDESKKKDDPIIITLGSVDIQEKTRSQTPEKGMGERLKHSDYNRYLYMQLQHVEMELELLGPHKFQKTQSYVQAVRQVQHMKGLLESHLCSSGSISERCSPTPSFSGDGKKGSSFKGLPWWFVFIGWFLIAATSGVSGFFTMLYGLHYGKENSIKWLISMAISFFESLFITQPLKVLGFAAFFALVLKKVEHEDEENTAIAGPLSAPGDSNPLFGARRDSRSNIYQPPPATDIQRMKNNHIKEQKAFALIREILAYLGFLWMLLLVAYGQRDPNSYYLNKHIESSFTDGFRDIYSYQDFFTWARTTLVNKLYGSYQGFITDGNSKLVGSARIRQVRVKGNTCPIAPKLQGSVQECHATYSPQAEDTSDYGEHWNISAFDNSSALTSAWKYQSQSKLRGHPVWGKLAIYRGGGYVVHLGTDPKNATRILQYLFNNVWLDTFTRAVFVEFTVYNANVNLFCIISLMFETNALGAFFTHAELQSIRLYPYTDGLHIFVVAAEVIYFLFVIYYMVAQTNLIFGWKLNSYKTLFDSAETMVSLQLGIFNYEEVLDYNPILGSFLIGSCIIFMTFVVLNLFISVILVAFSEEQKHYQASEEEEIVDLMLMKIFSFLGIKYKKEEKPTNVEQLKEAAST